MKIKTIIKKLEKEFKISFWLSLLPVILVVWIVSQLFILTSYNAVIFFSWGQVLNDTIILSLLVWAFIWWYLSHDLFLKFNPSFCEKWRGFLFIIYIWFLVSVVLGLILHFTGSFNYYIVWILLFYLLWYVSYFSLKFWQSQSDQKLDEKYWIFLVPSVYLIIYLLIFTLLFCWVKVLNSFIFKNTQVIINEQTYKVNYMNDKYIFYWVWTKIKIIPNDGKYEFVVKNMP